MSPFLQLATELVIILLAAKTAGYISMRLGQPSVLGELLVGVLLGPSLANILGLPFINSSSLGSTITELSELGVLLLMFLAGLELHLGELTSNRKVSLLASLGGLFLSIGLGWGAGRIFGMTDTAALFMGLALAATSVSISARTLMELGFLRSRVGLSLLGAAVVDDVLSIVAFSIFLAIHSADAHLPGAGRGIRPVGAAGPGQVGGKVVHQPGVAGVRHHRPAVIRSGSRAGRSHGSHHRYFPGRVDVRPHA
jgi:Kef-type K+ transport system membrane component KefB